MDLQLSLLQRQGLARGDLQLPLHEVQARDHLGDRVLDLQPRVHLHEVEAAVLVGDELDGAGAHVAHGLGGGHRGVAHGLAPGGRHAGRGRFLQHFLVAALHRAVTLEQVDAVALGVGKDLDLDVARAGEVFLDQHPVVAERGLGFALAGSEGRGEVGALLDHTHALAAAAGRGLDEDGVADLVGFGLQERRLLPVAVVAGHQRHAGLLHQRLGRALGAHRANRIRRRADEHYAGLGACGGEVRVLRQEPVAGVDGLRAGALRHLEDRVAAQVAVLRRGRADAPGLVGQAHMARVGVGFGVDGDHADA